MAHHESKNQNEFIKCVVVGDSGVGKTCLTCSWACNAHYTLEKLVKTHVASVWAIDHYARDPEILRTSVVNVDGVHVSLRIWDTFGYHDKNRKFAYKGADVILLCYSVVNRTSLQNLTRYWIPEVKCCAPATPVVIVGTQADLRYICRDEMYRKVNKGFMYRTAEVKDIVFPQEGRALAEQLKAPYYECSVYTRYGINDVFINAIRTAVMNKKLWFWNIKLHHIKKPLIQEPMNIPALPYPEVNGPNQTLHGDLCRLLYNQLEGDVVFIVRGVRFRAHKICLVIAANLFEDIFLWHDSESGYTSTSPSTSLPLDTVDRKLESSIEIHCHEDLANNNGYNDKENNGNDVSIDQDENGNRLSVCEEKSVKTDSCSDSTKFTKSTMNIQNIYPAFLWIAEQCFDNPYNSDEKLKQTIIHVNTEITPRAFQFVLEYLYTARVEEDSDCFGEARHAAELMNLHDLILMIDNLQSKEKFLNVKLEKKFREARCRKLRELALEKNLLADIVFQLDDGQVSAHKPLLMGRCEMMSAMFSANFRESSFKVIPFLGINCASFNALKEYLYTGELPRCTVEDCLDMIELANCLCLPQLVKLMEVYIKDDLLEAEKKGENITEDILLILELSQLHNADQLASWCLRYLCNHFRQVKKNYNKQFKELKPENRIFITKEQWPPQWYDAWLTDYEKNSEQAVCSRKKRSKCVAAQSARQCSWLEKYLGCFCCYCR
ncbi:hypothetical protein CHS0354_004470 [Potamilus streckersoni]|uniref:BTB domain-containing protein n=1 Tax=Potamilus streckersoni TaxID=2493646 RepID=A0AAE0VYG6_9BIVA|nr:hypothetical protein CHS0354_004470 [Potamilus streckersoni]